VRGLSFAPPAEYVVDAEHSNRELRGVLGGHGLVARPEMVARHDVLPFGRVQILEIRFRDAARRADRRRRRRARPGLRENADRGHDDVERVRSELLRREQASFSHASSTSPMPRWTKVLVAARAPASCTGTWR
jgi:hypothetical protein